LYNLPETGIIEKLWRMGKGRFMPPGFNFPVPVALPAAGMKAAMYFLPGGMLYGWRRNVK
jgi:hypothetical protein